jgi:hypothetical protein
MYCRQRLTHDGQATLSSEREHEDTARVVPRLQLDYQTSIASWHRGVPVTLDLSKVVPWLRRLVCGLGGRRPGCELSPVRVRICD